MAKSKSEIKRLAVQKPEIDQEVEGTLHLDIKYTLQTGRPVVSFNGAWTTRDVKNILRAIPRAYRLYQVNKRKQNASTENQGA